MKKLLLAICFLALASVSADAANRFAVCTTTCTWDGASTAMWSTTTGGATGASVPGSSDAVILDGATCVGGTTCTITVNTTVNVVSINMDACTASTTGCVLDFSVNNNTATMATFSSNGSGTRALKMGNNLWSMTTPSGIPWAVFGSNMTLTPNGSTLKITGTTVNNRTVTLAGALTTVSYNNITLDSDTGGFVTTIAAGNSGTTVGSVTLNTPLSVEFLNQWTITTAIAWAGTAFNNVLGIKGGGTLTVAAGSTINWATLRSLTFGGSAVNATNSFNLQNNNMNGGSISGPSSGGGGGHIIGG